MTTIQFAPNLGLGDLIARLEREDPARVLPIGFADPHSYRGYYEQLAFEPRRNIAIGDMLEAARSALGTTYEGYKGGEYTMADWTTCWIAHEGSTSDNMIGPLLLELLLAQPEPTSARAADGYQQAIDTLLGVFQRTGSPAAKWAAEYLAIDPDKQGPRARPPGYERQVRMVEHGRELLKDYDCPDHPGPLDDARDHICRLRPVGDIRTSADFDAWIGRVNAEFAGALDEVIDTEDGLRRVKGEEPAP